MTNKIFFFLIALALFIAVGCNGPSTESMQSESVRKNHVEESALKVYIDSNGVIWVNGSTKVGLNELEEQVRKVKGENGWIIYSKDLKSPPPRDSATQVLDLFVETGVRITFPKVDDINSQD